MLIVHHACGPAGRRHADTGPSHHELHGCKPYRCAAGGQDCGGHQPGPERAVSAISPRKDRRGAGHPTRNTCTATKTAPPRKTSFNQQGANYSPRKSALERQARRELCGRTPAGRALIRDRALAAKGAMVQHLRAAACSRYRPCAFVSRTGSRNTSPGICGGKRGGGRWPTGPGTVRCRAGARSLSSTAEMSGEVVWSSARVPRVSSLLTVSPAIRACVWSGSDSRQQRADDRTLCGRIVSSRRERRCIEIRPGRLSAGL